jgi:hypothetical protein
LQIVLIFLVFMIKKLKQVYLKVIQQIKIKKQLITMETILLYIFSFIVVMTLLLWMIPIQKIKAIGGFFVVVLPRIPFVGMIKAIFEAKNKNDKGK